MAMTYRDEKGSPLSAAEVDANFRTLVEDIASITENLPVGVGIASVTVNGLKFTVHLTNGSVQGPFDLPVTPGWNYRYELASLGSYLPFDVFTVTTGDERNGIYLVIGTYTAPALVDDFDPDALSEDTEGGPALQMLMATGSNLLTINPVTAATYTLSAADVNSYLRIGNGSGDVTIYVPNQDGDFPIGGACVVRMVGTGVLSFVSEAATTEADASIIHSPETLSLRKTHSTATITRVADLDWDLAGDLLPEAVTEP